MTTIVINRAPCLPPQTEISAIFAWHAGCTSSWATQGGARVNASKGPIALVEAAYDLEIGEAGWLPNLMRAGSNILDLGEGCAGAILAGRSRQGEPLVSQLHTENASEDLARGLARAALEAKPSLTDATPPPPERMVHVLSEARRSHPKVYEALTHHLGCKDMLTLWAMDPDVHGVGIHIPSSRMIDLDQKARQRWRMLSSHICAGHRLRRRLGYARQGVPLHRLSLEGGALLDSKRFSAAHASGEARGCDALAAIRKAAVQMDLARRRLRRGEVDEALNLWEEVMRGRWSVVDSFDSDGRRFILALSNAHHVHDPRGLTEREYQVAAHASTGDSCKLISYRLGISRSRVSALLRRVMLKLGVHTRAELMIKIRAWLADTASKM